mmetsp:Transcript_114977/g.245531  ORF Transcript_114977/g.245531 Transcript_114977/m.245531 type:complete len:239 (-) Transcript_114977:353-1069(-)
MRLDHVQLLLQANALVEPPHHLLPQLLAGTLLARCRRCLKLVGDENLRSKSHVPQAFAEGLHLPEHGEEPPLQRRECADCGLLTPLRLLLRMVREGPLFGSRRQVICPVFRRQALRPGEDVDYHLGHLDHWPIGVAPLTLEVPIEDRLLEEHRGQEARDDLVPVIQHHHYGICVDERVLTHVRSRELLHVHLHIIEAMVPCPLIRKIMRKVHKLPQLVVEESDVVLQPVHKEAVAVTK